MTSILTNTGSMVALQTLRSINSNLSKTQNEISTGKSVGSAKDNSAVWAISKVMESDVAGFQAVSDSLATGQSMVGVALTATEKITDLLKDIKTKVVAAQDPSADTTKLQDEADQKIGELNSILKGAQFNGVNLVNNATDQSVLGSIDRSGSTVTANTVTITAADLGSDAGTTATATLADGGGGTAFTVGGTDDVATVTVDAAGDSAFTLSGVVANETISVTINNKNYSYTATAADAATTTPDDVVVTALRDKIMADGITGLTVDYDAGTPGTIKFTNGGTTDLSITVRATAAGTGNLSLLGDGTTPGNFDITGATALADIETMINSSIDAAASFGAVQSRLEGQADFVSKLTDSLNTGIGSLVDADMEEVSARLQALQTQQQLGIQSLSIANSAPQNVLSLFK